MVEGFSGAGTAYVGDEAGGGDGFSSSDNEVAAAGVVGGGEFEWWVLAGCDVSLPPWWG